MKAKVYVTFKKGILDPQGKAVQHSLEVMEFDEVMDVRQGKVFELTLSEDISPEDAEKRVTEMAEKLLANTVMENFRVEIG
jgi:phosphoribosylformylglycinamidine synthase